MTRAASTRAEEVFVESSLRKEGNGKAENMSSGGTSRTETVLDDVRSGEVIPDGEKGLSIQSADASAMQSRPRSEISYSLTAVEMPQGLPLAKFNIGYGRWRLSRDAEIFEEVTSICRRLSEAEDPILNGLLCDDVISFSIDYEVESQRHIMISGVCVELLVAAVLCRARAIADHIQAMSHSVTTTIRAAQAAVLNDDRLLFRRVTEQMTDGGVTTVSTFAARMARYGFIRNGATFRASASSISSAHLLNSRSNCTSSCSRPSLWLDEDFFPASNAKDLVVRPVSDDGMLILDHADSPKQEAMDGMIIEKYVGLKNVAEIKQIRLFGEAKSWKRYDEWRMGGLWPGVENVDFSKSGLISIESWGLAANEKLAVVVLPDTLAEIGNLAFCGCDSLKIVNFGNGLKTLGESAFHSCGLTEVVLPDTVTKIGNWAFASCKSLKLAKICGELRTLGQWAFGYCENMIEVVLDSVIEIGRAAFSDCHSLKNVKVGNRLESSGDAAFRDCRSLLEIVLPDTVTEIKAVAFRGCSSLKTLSLGKIGGSLNRGSWQIPACTKVKIRT
jgi:hypothetical protein